MFANLAKLKARIAQHIYKVTLETLQSAVKYSVYRFQLVEVNVGQHTEHVLRKVKSDNSLEISFDSVLWDIWAKSS